MLTTPLILWHDLFALILGIYYLSNSGYIFLLQFKFELTEDQSNMTDREGEHMNFLTFLVL